MTQPLSRGRNEAGQAIPLDDFIAVFAGYFSVSAEIHPTSRLIEDLAFDSLLMLEVWDFLCDVHNADLPIDTLQSLTTIEDIHYFYCNGQGR